MTFLVTNDDGFYAEGICVLKEQLLKDGHTVYVMAPSENRSAVSHGMTFSTLEFIQISQNEWSCSGKPVDCVLAALSGSIFPKKIDAVLSGINAGANIGTDVVYSGTCAAARQAVLQGVPGIAFSLQTVGKAYTSKDFDITSYYDIRDKRKLFYEPMASFASKNIETLVSICRLSSPKAFVSVNALSLPYYKGVDFCRTLSNRQYKDSIDLNKDKMQNESNVFQSSFLGSAPVSSEEEDSDFYSVIHGNVAVSLINAEPSACSVDGIKFSL